MKTINHSSFSDSGVSLQRRPMNRDTLWRDLPWTEATQRPTWTETPWLVDRDLPTQRLPKRNSGPGIETPSPEGTWDQAAR